MKTTILAISLSILLGACAAPKKEPPPKPFIGTKWVVQLELPIAGEQPWFRFGDGRLEGFGGCNRVNARFVQDSVGARALAVGRLDRGTRACEASAQSAEMRVLELLSATSSYTITADTMVMSGSAGSLNLRSDPPHQEKP